MMVAPPTSQRFRNDRLMSFAKTTSSPRECLPQRLRALFWDQDFTQLDWQRHRDFVIGRILEAGPWEAIGWLRKEVGDDAVREWIERHRGRSLSGEQLRFWQLILDLPAETVDVWLQSPERKVWEHREPT
jgi:hypothetical protein